MFVNFLIEDASGKKMLDILLPKLLPQEQGIAYKVHSYKGVGRIPAKGSVSVDKIRARALLDNLPKIIGGLGNVALKSGFEMAVVVVCDLDRNDHGEFLNQLKGVLRYVINPPPTYFCLAIEEGEAWLLGDMPAIRTAFSHCKVAVLRKYRNDSICGTWELLANAVEPGGAAALKKGGYQVIGAAKCKWAEAITPHMVVTGNKSPSFKSFVTTVQRIVVGGASHEQ